MVNLPFFADLGTLVQAAVAVGTALAATLTWYLARRGSADESDEPPVRIGLAAPRDGAVDSGDEIDRAIDEIDELAAEMNWLFSPSITVDLLQLAGLEGPTAEAVCDRWERSWNRPLLLSLGTDHRSQPVVMNMADRGPSLAVVGNSGSGTTQTLQSVVEYLCVSYPPSRVRIHLAAFKFHTAPWIDYESLPHVSSLWDIAFREEHEASFVGGIRSLMETKRQAIELAGETSLASFNRSAEPEKRLPWDFVVIDEYHYGRRESDHEIEQVLRMGPALGIGVVAAFQAEHLMGHLSTYFRLFILQGSHTILDCSLLDRAVRALIKQARSEASNRIPAGRGLLLSSGHVTRSLQVATTGSWKRDSLDSPHYRNDELSETLRIVAQAAVD